MQSRSGVLELWSAGWIRSVRTYAAVEAIAKMFIILFLIYIDFLEMSQATM
jgi:hypothetical protein